MTDDDQHCYHHTCDDDCAAGDCADRDDCVCCECCCDCLGCIYAPQDGMLLFDPTADEPFTPAVGQ